MAFNVVESEGLSAVLREFEALIGTKEKAEAVLRADGESHYNKV